MAAPNQQPAGKIPGPAAPHTHAPVAPQRQSNGHSPAPSVKQPGKGTPKPVGKNSNRLR